MSHSFTTNNRLCYFYSTFLTDNILKTNTAVFTTVTFVILFRTEDTLIEESVTFLNDMVLHHEDAVRMAHQVLGLVGISENVKKLAESIISSQSAEISLMNEWLEASKTTKATTK